MSCSAFGCKLRHNQGFSINFFRFPLRDRRRLKQWVMNVRRQNWTPTPASRLCSMHFEEDQFLIDNMKEAEGHRCADYFQLSATFEEKGAPSQAHAEQLNWGVNHPLVSPADHYIVVVKQEPAEETNVDVKQEPAEETNVDVKQEPAEETNVDVKQEPAEETNVDVKQEPAEETDVVDDVLPDYIVKLVIKADVNEAAAEDNADVDEVAADDITECTTSGDSKTVILDHDYFSKKQKEIRMCSDHMYGISESPVILKRRVNELCDKLVEARKKVQVEVSGDEKNEIQTDVLKNSDKGSSEEVEFVAEEVERVAEMQT